MHITLLGSLLTDRCPRALQMEAAPPHRGVVSCRFWIKDPHHRLTLYTRFVVCGDREPACSRSPVDDMRSPSMETAEGGSAPLAVSPCALMTLSASDFNFLLMGLRVLRGLRVLKGLRVLVGLRVLAGLLLESSIWLQLRGGRSVIVGSACSGVAIPRVS